MKGHVTRSLLVLGIALMTGCSSGDPAPGFIAEKDRGPAEKHPPNWEHTKALMARPVPKVGDPAPDFALKTADGAETITRSKFQADRPLVLVFGSFT